MGIELSALYSTRDDNGGAIHVTVENRGDAATARLAFSVCDAQYRLSLPLARGETRDVAQPHDRTGLCNVTVSEETSGDEVRKYLDLDQPRSD